MKSASKMIEPTKIMTNWLLLSMLEFRSSVRLIKEKSSGSEFKKEFCRLKLKFREGGLR